MKTIVAVAVLFAITTAEPPPPSNSYLPPSPNQRSNSGYTNGGYSAAGNGLPQVVAARSEGNGPLGVIPQGIGNGNGYPNGPQGQGYEQNAAALARNGYPNGPQGQGYEQNAAALARNALEQQNAAALARNALEQQNAAALARNALEQQNAAALARNALEQQNAAALARNALEQQNAAALARNALEQQNAAALARNALEQQNSEPANYNFEYMVNDFEEGTDFGHQEERFDDSAHGEYHVVLPDGRKQTVSYEADDRGFKPRISYEDSDSFARSGAGGYDANANRVDQPGARGGNQANGGRNGY